MSSRLKRVDVGEALLDSDDPMLIFGGAIRGEGVSEIVDLGSKNGESYSGGISKLWVPDKIIVLMARLNASCCSRWS